MRPNGRPATPVPGLDSGEARRSACPETKAREANARRCGGAEGGGASSEVRGGGRDTGAVDAGEHLPAHGLRRAHRQGGVSRGAARPDPGRRGEGWGAGRGGVGGGEGKGTPPREN